MTALLKTTSSPPLVMTWSATLANLASPTVRSAAAACASAAVEFRKPNHSVVSPFQTKAPIVMADGLWNQCGNVSR